ncbi:UDP-4-amino-4,6-dideoxy-N-acetyl-beta-L-altrosamine transaminase [Pedobacter puniceum]|jgi:UDP-4-amino-4,6-dideoxy-N-acetyl-beta-L-altrosamine transaminase|uniref:UDP-4-amino-4, 6-dideoxy-N-acetyl-beta-L-altrosamine transaminase n=1 Tax=Pedobacter puniceum TaxID=2666136 RepID=A0A7K0FRJ5_9SPHI|nr:UDP-4-amino-4,6-dideoxy-N-acetyl-beta-L-altrosamine transaminase [Pedobacter puniceum]MRX48614.1 UDP-4-amino-4,6-dideoxy-N-acetyl-beta-L-altrosamine transaminase [Pedobacter puniceum]
MKAIPYGRQTITDEDIQAVVEVLKSDFLTQGPHIATFEQKFADYVGAKYAVAVSNGTAALHLCALALNVNEKSNVITSPITFAASANCIKYCGGEVFFADIDPKTFLLDITKVRALIESKPKGFFSGIVPVDFAGNAVDLEAFRKLADEFGLWIIEDACHAPGGYFIDSHKQQQNCGNGNFADLSIFSFHPVKHIATGEGGMITTNNPALYENLLLLRTHGITKNATQFQNEASEVAQGGWYYEMQELGYNYRITDFQAALGSSQLERAAANLERRRVLAKQYDAAFENTAIIKPINHPGNAYHLYVIQIKDRLGLYNYLKENHIYAQVHYVPVHLMPYYQKQGYKKGDFPLAEKYYEACLSIPMYQSLTDDEQQYIIETILKFVK